MNYQVCWKYKTDSAYDPWHAAFFHLRDSAVELYKVHKSLGHDTKILSIGEKK